MLPPFTTATDGPFARGYDLTLPLPTRDDAVATIDVLPLPLEAVYVFAAGVILREALGFAYWVLQE